jgi:hypothetical protein
MTEARIHGTRCLELKDAAVTLGPVRSLADVPVPPFDPSRPERNSISFSLFGDNEHYMRTAILNARAARFIYLGWTCTFFIDDSVPAQVVQALGSEGARLLKVNGLPVDPFGTFWRFLIADDQEVDRYIVRDADSVVNIREFVAVQEWLASGRHFHVNAGQLRSRRAHPRGDVGRCARGTSPDRSVGETIPRVTHRSVGSHRRSGVLTRSGLADNPDERADP